MQRIPYAGLAGYDPDPDLLTDDKLHTRRLEALERDNKHLREVVRNMESAMKVAARVIGPYAAKAGNGC